LITAFSRIFSIVYHARFSAFAIALKHRLRESVNTQEELAELSGVLLPSTLDLVMSVNNRPGVCLRLMNEFFLDKSSSAEVSELLLVNLQGLIADLNSVQTACERILDTPIPQPFLIQIRQLVFLYVHFFRTVSLDNDLNSHAVIWMTAPLPANVAFMFSCSLLQLLPNTAPGFGRTISEFCVVVRHLHAFIWAHWH
jgi:predicted membrane chloride channel (bestrophin family)